MQKETLVRLLSTALDGHTHNQTHPVAYLNGVKHVRELIDTDLGEAPSQDEVDEFCVGIICSIQPARPNMNHLMTDVERGILAAAYCVYSAVHPFATSE